VNLHEAVDILNANRKDPNSILGHTWEVQDRDGVAVAGFTHRFGIAAGFWIFTDDVVIAKAEHIKGREVA
jgi:hypothetical protein